MADAHIRRPFMDVSIVVLKLQPDESLKLVDYQDLSNDR